MYAVVGSRRLLLVDVTFGAKVVGSVEALLDAADDVLDGGSMMIANVLIEVTVTAFPSLLVRLAGEEVD